MKKSYWGKSFRIVLMACLLLMVMMQAVSAEKVEYKDKNYNFKAIKNVLPALANEVITMVKESSVCMVLGMAEIMFTAQTIGGSTYISIGPYMLAAFIYFAITYPTSKVIERIERRMRRGDKR